VLVALGLGCELTSELGVYTALDDETVAAPDTDTGTDSAEGGTSGGETETGDGEAGDGDGEAGDGDGDGLCDIDGSEDPCQVCLEFLCCEFLGNCDAESGCNCMVECLIGADPVTCAMTCAPGPAYFQLLQCQTTNCGAVCE
jgi:hypothetical protein